MAKVIGVGGGGLDEALKARLVDGDVKVNNEGAVVESSINESFEHHAYDALVYAEVREEVDSSKVFRDLVSGKKSNRRW